MTSKRIDIDNLFHGNRKYDEYCYKPRNRQKNEIECAFELFRESQKSALSKNKKIQIKSPYDNINSPASNKLVDYIDKRADIDNNIAGLYKQNYINLKDHDPEFHLFNEDKMFTRTVNEPKKNSKTHANLENIDFNDCINIVQLNAKKTINDHLKIAQSNTSTENVKTYSPEENTINM